MLVYFGKLSEFIKTITRVQSNIFILHIQNVWNIYYCFIFPPHTMAIIRKKDLIVLKRWDIIQVIARYCLMPLIRRTDGGVLTANQR
jgi:hypothetical protein